MVETIGHHDDQELAECVGLSERPFRLFELEIIIVQLFSMLPALVMHRRRGRDNARGCLGFVAGKKASSENEWSNDINHKRQVEHSALVARSVLSLHVDDSGVVYEAVEGIIRIKVLYNLVCEVLDAVYVGEIVVEVFQVVVIDVIG